MSPDTPKQAHPTRNRHRFFTGALTWRGKADWMNGVCGFRDAKMGAKRIRLTLMGALLIGIWVWMHFAQSHVLILFCGSQAQITIGHGIVEGHLVIGKPRGIRSLRDMDIMANSTSYAMLTPSDCIVAADSNASLFPNDALPESLFVDEPEDPFSIERPQPDPFSVTHPSVLATLFGGHPSIAWERGGGLIQLILMVPYCIVVIVSFFLAAVFLRIRKAEAPKKHSGSISGGDDLNRPL